MELAQWKQEYLDRLNAMTNGELLDETIEMACGDDYDGCHTRRGAWKDIAAHHALYERLRAMGFLTEEDVTRMQTNTGDLD